MTVADWKSPAFAAQLLMAQKLRWMVDDYAIDKGMTHVRGWVLAPFNQAADIRFLANGRTLLKPDQLVADSDVQRLLVPDLPQATFRFTLSYPASAGTRFHSIAFLPSGVPDSCDSVLTSWYLLDPQFEDDPLPDGENIYRVIANRGTDTYRLGGATVANRLNRYLWQARGQTFATIGKVLDWGCGCARVSRYVRKLGCQSLYGVDVDQTNVAWCNTHLPWFPVQLSGLAPPLPFKNRTFDLIFGISIFTHLREASQFAWLHELARVLKPGGLAIMTVMREGQIALQQEGPDAIARLTRERFVISDDNDQLKLGKTDENYYVNAYHSADYIFSKWADQFEVLDIIPFLGAHQDAVVLQLR